MVKVITATTEVEIIKEVPVEIEVIKEVEKIVEVTVTDNELIDKLDLEKNQLNKRINSICRFDFVDKVKSKNIDQKNNELVLELIGIDYMKNRNDYEINLIFNNNAHIALTTETIEVRLEDQNEIEN